VDTSSQLAVDKISDSSDESAEVKECDECNGPFYPQIQPSSAEQKGWKYMCRPCSLSKELQVGDFVIQQNTTFCEEDALETLSKENTKYLGIEYVYRNII
jgi:hypothetical protein